MIQPANIVSNFGSIHVQEQLNADYLKIWQAMQDYTSKRTTSTLDELWLIEHTPVYTVGKYAQLSQAPSKEVPTIRVDRGGELTWHGPGQLCVYFLLDFKRKGWSVIHTVQQVLNFGQEILASIGVESYQEQTGLITSNGKIASCGMSFKRQGCYHGLSINVNNDLAAFNGVETCGIMNRTMTTINAELKQAIEITQVIHTIKQYLQLSDKQAVQ